MIVYLYDSETGEFLDTYSPQENPKRKGEYLLPKYSTKLRPENKNGYVSIFDGTKWVYKTDFRGEEIINPETNTKTVCQNLGNLPEGYVLFANYVQTDEYKQMIETRLREEKRQELIAQIDKLDKKRIRAICEPEQKTENVSWLEFYTAQIVELRKQLQEV